MSEVAQVGETFFTSVGCMDGRVQKAVEGYASLIFGAEFPDTITMPGLDGVFAKDPVDKNTYESVRAMVAVSVRKHKSYGIVVHGHEGCAGNPVSYEQHKKDVEKSVEQIKTMLGGENVVVKGVYVHLKPRIRVEEVLSP